MNMEMALKYTLAISTRDNVHIHLLHAISLHSDTIISTQYKVHIELHNSNYNTHSEWDRSYKDRIWPVQGSSWVLCSCISSHWPGTACSFRLHSCAQRPWNGWWTCTHQTVCVCACVCDIKRQRSTYILLLPIHSCVNSWAISIIQEVILRKVPIATYMTIFYTDYSKK